MDGLWHDVATEPHYPPAAPPGYIADCAAYRAASEAAVQVGHCFYHAVRLIERPY